jgi:hypothetical protein
MLNAAAASAYGHKKVEPNGGRTCRFQKSREPFQSGTPRVTRTNLVLIGQMSGKPTHLGLAPSNFGTSCRRSSRRKTHGSKY